MTPNAALRSSRPCPSAWSASASEASMQVSLTVTPPAKLLSQVQPSGATRKSTSRTAPSWTASTTPAGCSSPEPYSTISKSFASPSATSAPHGTTCKRPGDCFSTQPTKSKTLPLINTDETDFQLE